MRRLPFVLCLLLAGLARCQSDTNFTTRACSFKGDEDTYGLGIRVGIYVQWFIMNYANIFALDEAANMRSINIGFAIAIFAGKSSFISFSIIFPRASTDLRPLQALEI
jgi:hypothetical protein